MEESNISLLVEIRTCATVINIGERLGLGVDSGPLKKGRTAAYGNKKLTQ
jgi:hypothetical protein